MGRHSSPRQWRYYASLLKYFLPWILVAVVGVGAVWAGVGSLGDDELETSPGITESEPPKRSKRPAPTPDPVETTAKKAEGDGSKKDQQEQAEEEPLVTEGITVQVLNGTTVTGADQAMADRLGSLGFTVINTAPASINYTQTTVLWSYAESEEAAIRLAERFGWQVKPKPDNLSTQVAIHIVVGADETG